MKKYILLIFLVSILGYVLWENTPISENIVQSWSNRTMSQNLNITAPEDLKNIKAQFCNQEMRSKSLSLEMRPWQRKNICIVLFNTSDKPISLIFWFSSWKYNKDNVPICDGDIGMTNTFSKHILNNTILNQP